MNAISASSNAATLFQAREKKPTGLEAPNQSPEELRGAFDSFVGETFYGQMLKSLRELTDKPAYFHGGQAEEVFRGQLDQVLAEQFTANTAGTFTGPMFDLFQLQRAQ